MPGGEPWTNHVHRVTAALADITNSEADGHVLVVGHAETVTAAYQIFLAAPVLHRITLPVGHASLAQWRTVTERPNVTVTHQRWALHTHADQSHLNTNTSGRVTPE